LDSFTLYNTIQFLNYKDVVAGIGIGSTRGCCRGANASTNLRNL